MIQTLENLSAFADDIAVEMGGRPGDIRVAHAPDLAGYTLSRATLVNEAILFQRIMVSYHLAEHLVYSGSDYRWQFRQNIANQFRAAIGEHAWQTMPLTPPTHTQEQWSSFMCQLRDLLMPEHKEAFSTDQLIQAVKDLIYQ